MNRTIVCGYTSWSAWYALCSSFGLASLYVRVCVFHAWMELPANVYNHTVSVHEICIIRVDLIWFVCGLYVVCVYNSVWLQVGIQDSGSLTFKKWATLP